MLCFVWKCKLMSTTRRIIIFFDDLKLILWRVFWPRSETVIQLSTSPRKTWFLIVISTVNFCARCSVLLYNLWWKRNFAFVMFLSMFYTHELFILIIRNFFSKNGSICSNDNAWENKLLTLNFTTFQFVQLNRRLDMRNKQWACDKEK